MGSGSPTLYGLRTVLRTPALWLTEIAWRWTFKAAAALLVLLTAFEFLHDLRVSDSHLLLSPTRNRAVAANVLSGVLSGLSRLPRAAIVLLAGLAMLWVFAYALGRGATLKTLRFPKPVSFFGILILGFLRLGVALASILGLLGAGLLVGALMGPQGETLTSTTAAAIAATFLVLVVAVWLAWKILDWMLALAPVFVGSDGNDAISALGSALWLVSRRLGAYVKTTIWFGLFHFVALAGAILAFTFALALARPSPGAATTGLAMIALLYFAVLDFLHISRLAAYVGVAEDENEADPPPETPGPLAILDLPGEPSLPGFS